MISKERNWMLLRNNSHTRDFLLLQTIIGTIYKYKKEEKEEKKKGVSSWTHDIMIIILSAVCPTVCLLAFALPRIGDASSIDLMAGFSVTWTPT